jgi:hypothetical protein
MNRIEIDGQVNCPHPECEGIHDLVDCMSCEYHAGIEVNIPVLMGTKIIQRGCNAGPREL